MIELDGAQTWTVIGVLAAALLSAVGALSRFAGRANQESFARVLDRIDALDVRLSERIDALDGRITVVDRDVQAIANRAFGRGSATEA